ncbi:PadR family transcriptional regulator [Sphingobium sp.]|uniref:PadR family transcriptional regulator n=1 Tax=Sphingobium sp. TaxID=1912891 RepID=UPI002E1D1BE9
MEHHEILSGFIRLHILHHAAEEEIYGQWMMEELAHHGYRMSPGTLYPMLHALEKKGYLTSREEQHGRTFRKLYRATDMGRDALRIGREKLRELFREVGDRPSQGS